MLINFFGNHDLNLSQAGFLWDVPSSQSKLFSSMVDYSKFDKIVVDSSDECDDDSKKPTCTKKSPEMRMAAKLIVDGMDFPYSIGDNKDLVPFDIRSGACEQFGYQHGDVVLTEEGVVSTVIGVHAGRLWFHMEGAEGAGLWQTETLKKVGWVKVEAGRPRQAPSLASRWLTLDFAFTLGLDSSTAKVEYFDTRNQLCMKVGGFTHGQLIKLDGFHQKAVTIGVRPDEDGRVFLWFHLKGLILFFSSIQKRKACSHS